MDDDGPYSRGRGGVNKNHAKPPWEPSCVYIDFIKGFVHPHLPS